MSLSQTQPWVASGTCRRTYERCQSRPVVNAADAIDEFVANSAEATFVANVEDFSEVIDVAILVANSADVIDGFVANSAETNLIGEVGTEPTSIAPLVEAESHPKKERSEAPASLEPDENILCMDGSDTFATCERPTVMAPHADAATCLPWQAPGSALREELPAAAPAATDADDHDCRVLERAGHAIAAITPSAGESTPLAEDFAARCQRARPEAVVLKAAAKPAPADGPAAPAPMPAAAPPDKACVMERAGFSADSVPAPYLDTWARLNCQRPPCVSESEWRQAQDDGGRFFDQCGSLAEEWRWTNSELFEVPRPGQRGGLLWFIGGATVEAFGPDHASLSDGRIFDRGTVGGMREGTERKHVAIKSPPQVALAECEPEIWESI